MKRDKIFKVLTWCVFGISAIFSLISYKYLPDKVALQISFTGKLQNYVNKGLASIVIPVILLFLSIYSSANKEQNKVKYFFISLIIMAAHMYIIYMNIK